jgi:hypothetical protein
MYIVLNFLHFIIYWIFFNHNKVLLAYMKCPDHIFKISFNEP